MIIQVSRTSSLQALQGHSIDCCQQLQVNGRVGRLRLRQLKKDAKQLRLAAANAEHDKARKRVDMPAPMPAVKVGTVLQHLQEIASQLHLRHYTHTSQC